MNLDSPWVHMMTQEELDHVGEKDVNLSLMLSIMNTMNISLRITLLLVTAVVIAVCLFVLE